MHKAPLTFGAHGESLCQAASMHHLVEQATLGTQVPAALRPGPQQSQWFRPLDTSDCRAGSLTPLEGVLGRGGPLQAA